MSENIILVHFNVKKDNQEKDILLPFHINVWNDFKNNGKDIYDEVIIGTCSCNQTIYRITLKKQDKIILDYIITNVKGQIKGEGKNLEVVSYNDNLL
jgi:predicted component of type VI protein secretion system